MTPPMTPEQLDLAARLATQLRVDSIRCSTQAGSGHPTSSLSAADLMAVLMLGHLHYDWHQPDLPTNDHLIFSKGHASDLAAAVPDVSSCRRHRRERADQDLPATRPRLHPPRCCPGWTWPPAPSARDCPTPSVWAWPESTWKSCRITCGCCAGTTKPPKAPSARPWTRPASTGSATSPPSSTSTGWASAAPPNCNGTSRATPPACTPSAAGL